jgi:hypothetical protein
VGNTRTSKHRFRKRAVRRRPTWTGFESPKHTMWTVEGGIEAIDRFARSVNSSQGPRRWAGKMMLLLPFLAWMVVGVVTAIVWLVRWVL